MPPKKGLTLWLWKQRNSARLAYILTLSTRMLSSFMGLIWIRLLVGAMGQELNSVYLAYQKVISLGGLGDLGIGGAVGIRAGQYLGQGKEEELRKFLASARTVFLILAFTIGGGFLLLSPWLPQWLRFKAVEGAGSLRLLFAVGSFSIACVMLASYLNNLNYACGNVTWPVIPIFVLLQLSLLGHWLLARQHQPLWMQIIPYVASAAAGLCLIRFYVRSSHPPLAVLLPLGIDWRLTVSLFESSFWIYLCSLGNAIYRTTDGLVINAGFKPGTLAPYEYNYKFCELVVFLVLTASYVSLPKINQWMASSNPADQDRVRVEMRRLNQFQTLLGCGAALAYLGGNNLFMKLWWLHKANPILPAALPLQLAFALNLAVTASGDTGIQLALRSGSRGLRMAGAAVGLTGLLNLGLSIVAMKMGSLWGIAMATVIAQSVLSLVASFFTCSYLKIAWLPWALRGWLLPLAGISFAGWLRMKLDPLDSLPNIVLLVGVYAVMLLAAAWGLGINIAFIKEELELVRKFIRK
jgi:O-antigen/teichoic acid export membrane protein